MRQSMARTLDQLAGVTELVERFLKDLERQEASPRTRASYRLDLLHFFRWFAQTVAEDDRIQRTARVDPLAAGALRRVDLTQNRLDCGPEVVGYPPDSGQGPRRVSLPWHGCLRPPAVGPSMAQPCAMWR